MPSAHRAPARGLPSKPASLRGLALTAIVLLLAVPANAGQSPCRQLSAQAIAARVMGAQGVSDGSVTFTQQIRLHALLFNWEFTSVVTRSGDQLNVQIHDGPWFLPESFESTIADPQVVLRQFDIQKGEPEQMGGRLLCVLDGTRKAGLTTGAGSGRVWVDPTTWLIQKIQAHYSWGSPRMSFEYGVVGGHTVVTRQTASLTGFRLDIAYEGYQWSDVG